LQGGFDKRIADKKAGSIYQNQIEEVLLPPTCGAILLVLNTPNPLCDED